MRNQRSKWDAFLEALLPGETPVTFLMMLFCVATYLLGALQTHLLWESDGAALLRMGANFGPQTMAGGDTSNGKFPLRMRDSCESGGGEKKRRFESVAKKCGARIDARNIA